MQVCVRGATVLGSVSGVKMGVNNGGRFFGGQSGQRGFNNAGRDRRLVIVLTISSFITYVFAAHSARGLLAEAPFHGRSRVDTLCGLGHYLDAITCTAKQRHVPGVPGIMQLLHRFQELLLACVVTINQAGL
jgi:hypothetical protein